MSATFSARTSALPLAFECAGSLQPPDVPIDPVNEAGDMGTAAHDCMERLVTSGGDNFGGIDLVAIARKHGVDEDELQAAAFGGLHLWRLVRSNYVKPRCEVAMRAIIGSNKAGVLVELTGHGDLLSVMGNYARGGDWKFGRVDHDFREQMRGYCALALIANPQVERVDWPIYWMREKEQENHGMSRSELRPWAARFMEKIGSWDGVYHPGPGCTHCPRSYDCPAAVAQWRRDLAVIAEPSLAERIADGVTALEPAELGAVFARAKAIAAVCKSVTAGVRLRVVQAGGNVDIGGGQELRLNTTKVRELDVEKAWPILAARLEPGGSMAPFVKIKLGDFEGAVAKAAGKGNGAEAIRALTADLETAEAVGHKITQSLVAARKKET